MLGPFGDLVRRTRLRKDHPRAQHERLIGMTNVERPGVCSKNAEGHERPPSQEVE